MSAPAQRPLLFVVSAPSGAGKTTLCDRLLEEFRGRLTYSISCTTRPPREGEVDGVDYHFISRNEFDRKVKAGEFLEHAAVHDHFYGTLRAEIMAGFANGKNVLMDIDVQGAKQIREYLRSAPAGDLLKGRMIDVFILPPSLEILRDRLIGRGKDSMTVIDRRVSHAKNEMGHAAEYRFTIVNDDLEKAYAGLRSIFLATIERDD